MKNSIVFIVFALVFANCKKLEFKPDPGSQPVFSLHGMVEYSDSISITAGLDENWMQAIWNIDSGGVMFCAANLGPLPLKNPQNPRIIIEFRNTEVWMGKRGLPENIKPGFFTYAEGKSLLGFTRTIFFEHLPAGVGSPFSYNWWIDGVEIPGNSFLIKTHDLRYCKSVGFQLHNTDGTSSYNFKNVDFNDPQPLKGLEIVPNGLDGFWAYPSDTLNMPIVWFHSNGYDTTDYFKRVPGLNNLSAQTVFPDYSSALASVEINESDPQKFCIANFKVESSVAPDTDLDAWRRFGKVTVRYSPSTGNEYSSENVVQTWDSRFEILEMSDFEKNDAGHPTQKVKVRFNCHVKNRFGSIIRINEMSGIVAIAYPPD